MIDEELTNIINRIAARRDKQDGGEPVSSDSLPAPQAGSPDAFRPNRAQRRAMMVRLVNLPTKDLIMLWDLTNDGCKDLMLWRIENNMCQTQHPLHHLTANGAIVDADPTLEYCMNRLRRIPQFKQFMATIDAQVEQMIAQFPGVPRAVPVNRRFYRSDPYATRLS